MIVFLGTTPALQRTMTFAELRIDNVNRAADVHAYASGKSINGARVATSLGHPAIASGFLGGVEASLIRRDLDLAGIAHDFVDVEPATRTCVTVIDESRGTATEFIEESREVELNAYGRLLSKLATLLVDAKALVLSGTLPPGADDTFYARCAALAGSIPVIVDAKGKPLAATLERRPFLVKPNRTELEQTLEAEIDDDESLRGAMREITARGARWVVVTDGAHPVNISDGKQFWKIEVPRVQTISPIGSGDAFAAGTAVGVARGLEIPEACKLGTACAVANAITALAGHLRREDVDQIVARIALIPNP